jgi:hypothetical protein
MTNNNYDDDRDDDDYYCDHVYLRYYVTRRYSEEITKYFHRWFRLGLIHNLGDLQYETLRNYQKHVLQIVIDYLKDEIKWKMKSIRPCSYTNIIIPVNRLLVTIRRLGC